MERVLAAELAADTDPRADSAQEPTWVVARCVGKRVLLEVNDPLSRKTVQRTFDFGRSSPKARGRLLAIAASELVLASWAELSVRPKLRVEPEGHEPPAEQAAAAAQRARAPHPTPTQTNEAGFEPIDDEPLVPKQFHGPFGERAGERVVALASGRGLFQHPGLLYGGGLRFAGRAGQHSGWALDALIESGRPDGAGASNLRVDTWTIGGLLYICTGVGRLLTLRAGAGLRTGMIESSLGSNLHSGLAIWGWPMAAMSSTIKLQRFVVDLSAEGGYAALPVTSATHTRALRGAWLGFQLGIGAAL